MLKLGSADYHSSKILLGVSWQMHILYCADIIRRFIWNLVYETNIHL